MKRLYEHLISQHLDNERQMLFLTGPRQVGKTTTSREIADRRKQSCYLNWDNVDHQEPIVTGPSGLAEALDLVALREKKPLLILDEIQVPRLADPPEGFLRRDRTGDLPTAGVVCVTSSSSATR